MNQHSIIVGVVSMGVRCWFVQGILLSVVYRLLFVHFQFDFFPRGHRDFFLVVANVVAVDVLFGQERATVQLLLQFDFVLADGARR